MIRIVYRWQVESENFEEFQEAWSLATNKIHDTVPGALGSFMLREADNKTEILTIAKWDSIESWKAFWGRANPEEMEAMQRLGRRISVNIYNEIDDFTR